MLSLRAPRLCMRTIVIFSRKAIKKQRFKGSQRGFTFSPIPQVSILSQFGHGKVRKKAQLCWTKLDQIRQNGKQKCVKYPRNKKY